VRSVTYSMGVSLDGYIVGPDGGFDWTGAPDEEVRGSARLASGGVAREIERLRAEPGEGDIAIGGATLAAEAAALGLIDEYRARVYPVLVGGGIPFFPRSERRADLELVETRAFSSGVVYLRYREAR
jgi:dihydrofolate reductase